MSYNIQIEVNRFQFEFFSKYIHDVICYYRCIEMNMCVWRGGGEGGWLNFMHYFALCTIIIDEFPNNSHHHQIVNQTNDNG